jgi:hypothetical protein
MKPVSARLRTVGRLLPLAALVAAGLVEAAGRRWMTP